MKLKLILLMMNIKYAKKLEMKKLESMVQVHLISYLE